MILECISYLYDALKSRTTFGVEMKAKTMKHTAIDDQNYPLGMQNVSSIPEMPCALPVPISSSNYETNEGLDRPRCSYMLTRMQIAFYDL